MPAVRILLDAGASLEARDFAGHNVLERAVANCCRCADVLLAAGAEMHRPTLTVVEGPHVQLAARGIMPTARPESKAVAGRGTGKVRLGKPKAMRGSASRFGGYGGRGRGRGGRRMGRGGRGGFRYGQPLGKTTQAAAAGTEVKAWARPQLHTVKIAALFLAARAGSVGVIEHLVKTLYVCPPGLRALSSVLIFPHPFLIVLRVRVQECGRERDDRARVDGTADRRAAAAHRRHPHACAAGCAA